LIFTAGFLKYNLYFMFVVMYVYILVAKPRAECVETKARPRL